MKKKITFFVLLCVFISTFSSLKAEIIDVIVMSNQFVPDVINASVGDQIRWTLLGGNHTTTSDIVPPGAEPWNYQFSGLGDDFIYDVTVEGSYSYLCIFHGGMVGSIEVVLPIELSSFTASVYENKIILLWTTVMEVNNNGFDIERKKSESSFWNKVGFVKGNGTTSKANNYTFIDHNVDPGVYNYRLKQIDYNGNFEYFNLSDEISIGVPKEFSMSQNYPNPFNPVTRINYQLPFESSVSLIVYDMTGRKIASIVNAKQSPGNYTIVFNASGISSGIYFYRLTAEGNNDKFVSTKRMIVVK